MSSKAPAYHISRTSLTLHSIIAVQGLGARPFYTWSRNLRVRETYR